MSRIETLPAFLRYMIVFIQILLYITIQIAFLPLTLIGLAVAIPMEMGRTKKDGISFSAVKALQYRWIAHNLGLRPDPASVAFTRKFPYESQFGMWAVLGPQIIAKRLFGFTPKAVRIVPPEETSKSTAITRVLLFDSILEKYGDSMEQIVLPGAGFDLIALSHADKEKHTVFELDQENTLKAKTDTLQRAGIPHDWIHYIPVDYAAESWSDKLLEAGFDPKKKTLFLWQSVSLFLESEQVEQALKDMAALCTEGSVIAQDFYSQTFISGEMSKAAQSFIRLLGRMGEPVKFGLDITKDPKETIPTFLEECGLNMIECIQFGEKLERDSFYWIVEAGKA